MPRCETCRFWKKGDQTSRGIPISNYGNCTYFMSGHEPPHGKRTVQIPIWAYNLAFRTVSWQGTSCLTWESHND